MSVIAAITARVRRRRSSSSAMSRSTCGLGLAWSLSTRDKYEAEIPMLLANSVRPQPDSSRLRRIRCPLACTGETIRNEQQEGKPCR